MRFGLGSFRGAIQPLWLAGPPAGGTFQGWGAALSWEDRQGTQDFDFGCALTVHKGQGFQWSNALVSDESSVFAPRLQKGSTQPSPGPPTHPRRTQGRSAPGRPLWNDQDGNGSVSNARALPAIVALLETPLCEDCAAPQVC